jgi:hypothetical protein
MVAINSCPNCSRHAAERDVAFCIRALRTVEFRYCEGNYDLSFYSVDIGG